MNDKMLKKVRVAVPVALVAIAAVAYVAKAPVGDLSAFGWGDLMLLCPLGALTAMIASQTMIPAAILSLICFVLLVVLVGKAFCAWACPVPLVGKVRGAFAGKKAKEVASATAEKKAKACGTGSCGSSAGCDSCASKRGAGIDSRHIILGGALGTTLLFGFPVFCLVCPIGLTFATVFVVANLFTHGDVTWTVVIVPALLLAEVVFFRKWCHRLCPLSALMSLTAKANRTLVPVIADDKCLETAAGVACGRCGAVCDEGIDLRHPELSQAAMNECTKCRLCADACPGKAITFPVGPCVPLRSERKAPMAEFPEEEEPSAAQ